MFRKIRFFWRLLATFLARHKKIVFFSFMLGIVAFFFLPRLLVLLERRPVTISLGLVGRYTTSSIPDEVQSLISPGLTQLKEDGTATVGLAQEWVVEDGGRTYTFKLSPNRFWHDGTQILAKDVNYKFSDVQMEVLEADTIRFKLQEPFSPFPTIVSRPLFKKGLVGAGSYKVKKIVRNGQFIESLSLQSQLPQKPNLKYRFYPTEAAAKTALKLGEVQVLKNIFDPSGFESWNNIEIKPQIKYDRYLAIFFNTSKSFLSEKNFRQALAYGIPKDGYQTRALGPISPLSWAYNDDVKPYLQDLANAKKLLEKTGGERPTAIKLTTSSSFLNEAEKIKTTWESLGIKTEIVSLTTPLTDFEALLAIREIPADPDQYSLWHSSQEQANITKLKNPRIDQLLEEGRKTQDVEKRKKIYFDFQRFLVEEVPAIFLYNPVTYEIRRK